jgi:hypothetical protein
MDNDSGRGSRSNEPPQLAAVRRLHLDADGSGATATEDWYETERLTGHITGGARPAAPIEPPAPARSETPEGLDWRHAPAVPAPNALQRLGQGRAARRDRRRKRELLARTRDADLSSRTSGVRQAVPVTESQAEPPTLPQEDEPAPDVIGAAPSSGPRIGLRESADPAPHRPRRRFAPSTRDAHPRLRRGVIVSVVLLGVAAVSVAGIASLTSGTGARPHQVSLVAATSTPAAGLNTAARTVIGVLGMLERRVPTGPSVRRRSVRAARRPRHKTRVRARHLSSRPAVGGGERTPVVAVPPSAPSTSSDATSSSAPGYSSQPATSQPAPVVTRSAPQPAGPSGPGGTVGNNCNPKCS